jgi:predicted alpha/beta-fold hydrolase
MVSFLAVLGILLLLLLSFIAFRFLTFLIGYRPTISVNPESAVAGYVQQLRSVRRMHATPWLLGPHMQTIWSMKSRRTSHNQPRRKEFTFSDGGVCILDWFEPEGASATTPIVVIVHTLAGGTREACRHNCAIWVYRHGWRAVVASLLDASSPRI